MTDLDPAHIDKAAQALAPHWRTDCSASSGCYYARWVRCRCGWASMPSETLVNVPDLHAIWNAHVARAVLEAVTPAIEANALREAAAAIRHVREIGVLPDGVGSHPIDGDDWLEARADQKEQQ